MGFELTDGLVVAKELIRLLEQAYGTSTPVFVHGATAQNVVLLALIRYKDFLEKETGDGVQEP